MKPILLGLRSGLRVSEFTVGTGRLGVSDGAGDAEEARRTLTAFADAGGNLIDTSSAHQNGTGEEIAGAFLAEAGRQRFVVSAKYGRASGPSPAASETGVHRGAMIASVETSLRRLRTDRIDLYTAEFPDGVTPLEEIMRGMDILVRAGKVVHVALSNFPAWQMAAASTAADLRGWAPLAAFHYQYNLAERSAEREHLPMAAALGLGVLAWSPLSGGLLGKAGTDDVAAALAEASRAAGIAPVATALAWLRTKGVIPVLGVRNVRQLTGCLEAAGTVIPEEVLARLDGRSPHLGAYPAALLKRTRESAGIDAYALLAAARV